jgi:hypothetical protein
MLAGRHLHASLRRNVPLSCQLKIRMASDLTCQVVIGYREAISIFCKQANLWVKLELIRLIEVFLPSLF